MDPTDIGLFNLAEKRLAWAAQRQGVLAANIANANTPGFQTQDIAPFAKVLSGYSPVQPVMTQAGHMAGTLPAGSAPLTRDPPTARALDGNSVALDEQLTKVADTETTQSLVTTVWKKYTLLFNIALGKG